MDTAKWMDFAMELSAVAVRISRDRHGNARVDYKPDGSHITEADTEIQAALCERIRIACPTHAVLCEESGAYLADMPPATDAEFCWVIDPLDGTRNYVRSLPAYCTSIALLRHSQPICGVIADHLRCTFYTAVHGQGAFCGSKRLEVAPPADRGPVVSFQPADDGSTYDQARGWIRDIHLRSFGSTALHLAYVAEGGLDAAVCIENRIWDLAAGALLVTEAGGVVTDLDGHPVLPVDLTRPPDRLTPFIAGEQSTHQRLLRSWQHAHPPTGGA